MGAIDFADLNWERRRYRPWRAYAQSKLANLLFTTELQRRLEVLRCCDLVGDGRVIDSLYDRMGGCKALRAHALVEVARFEYSAQLQYADRLTVSVGVGKPIARGNLTRTKRLHAPL